MHHHTELSFVDDFRWVSPLHYLKKRMTERCSSLVHVASGVASFTLLLCCHVAFLHRIATTCLPLFKPSVSLLSTYRQSSCVSNFYRTFKVFIWLCLVLCHVSFFQPRPEVEWCLVGEMSDFIEFFFSLCIISFLTQLFQLVFPIHLSTKFWNFHGTADLLFDIPNFSVPYKAVLQMQYFTSFCLNLKSTLLAKRVFFLNATFATAGFNFTCNILHRICYHATQTVT